MTNQEEIARLRAHYWGARTARAVNALTFQQPFKMNYIVDPEVRMEAVKLANQAVVNYGLACIPDGSLGERIYYRNRADSEFNQANDLLREAVIPIDVGHVAWYNDDSPTEE